MSGLGPAPLVFRGQQHSQRVFSIAEHLLQKHKFLSTGDRSPLWTYDSGRGIWRPVGSELIKSECVDILGPEFKTHTVSEVRSYVAAKTYIEMDKLGGPPLKIVMDNGVYDLETFTFNSTFDPSEYHITAIPVTYNPKAKCPNIQKFLGQIVDPNDGQAILEFLGQALVKDYIYELALLCTGRGQNGKSVLLDLVSRFLGPQNISSQTLQQLEESRFATSSLYGKLANIAPDIPSRAMQSAAMFKALTSGKDYISAERKFQESFQFVNYAKLIFSANEVPATFDQSDAYFRRWHIIDFPNKFEPSDSNYLPKEQLMALLSTPQELSGLFNLAVEGWKRLSTTHQLTGTLSVSQKKMRYAQKSDPAQFMAEYLIEQNANASAVPKSMVYDAYILLCKSWNRTPVQDNVFARKLKQFAPWLQEAVPDTTQPDGSVQRTKCWVGMTLRASPKQQ